MSKSSKREQTIVGLIPVFASFLAPAALTGNQNNYDPGTSGMPSSEATVWKIDPGGAARDITGFAGGFEGRSHLLVNTSTTAGRNIVLKHADAASSASNRILGANLADVTIRPCGAAWLMYDATAARWRAIAI